MERLVSQRAHKNPRCHPSGPGPSVCAFAFTGNFPAGQVAGSPANDSGKAAIVLVTTDHKLLFSFVLAKVARKLRAAIHGRLAEPGSSTADRTKVRAVRRTEPLS